MTLEASGTIKFKRDAGNKTPWTIASKQLGIEMDGSGDIDDMIERLTDRVREKFTEEFRTMPRSVSLAAYSMTFKFDVVGPVNHVLEDFGQGKYKATVRLADGTEIPLDKLTKTADQVIAVAEDGQDCRPGSR